MISMLNWVFFLVQMIKLLLHHIENCLLIDNQLISYFFSALKYHPDKNADCKDRFIQIQEAYEVLSNA